MRRWLFSSTHSRKVMAMAALLLMGMLPAGAQRPPGDTIVALRGKRVQVGDYTLDTLVKYLSLVNDNPHYRYVSFTDDETPTGYKADYVLDLDVAVTPAHPAPSRTERVPVQHWENRMVVQADGRLREQPVLVTSYETQPVNEPFRMMPARAVCTVRILQKWAYEKKSSFSFDAESYSDDGLPVRFLSAVVNQLLSERFPGGTGEAHAKRRAPQAQPGFATIAVHADGSLPGNYTVDTLVTYLDLLNENPNVRYVRLADDGRRRRQDAAYVLDVSVDTHPAITRCRITVYDKRNNGQKSAFDFSVRVDDSKDLPAQFLIELLYQLLEKHFAPAARTAGR